MGVCVAAAVAAYLFLPSLSHSSSSGVSDLLPQHPAALRTQKLALRQFHIPVLTPYVVVQRNPHGLSPRALADAYGVAVHVTTHHERRLQGLVAAAPIANTLGLFPGAHESGTTVVTYLFFRNSRDTGADTLVAQRYAALFPPADDVVGVSGALPARLDQYKQISSYLHLVEGATVLLIVLIVGLSLRAVLAPLLVVGTAGLAFLISQRVLGWMSVHEGLGLPRELTAVAVALMLGIVTDYSVFFLAGTRRRLAAGERRTAAVRVTAREVAPTVFTAGMLVSCGVATLMLGTLRFFRTFGPGMAVTVFTGLVVSLLFVPGVLALLGRAIFWPGLAHGTFELSLTGRFVSLLRRRVVAIVVCTAVAAVLLAAVTGVPRTGLGAALVSALPSSDPVARAGNAAAKGFSAGILAPTELLVEQHGIGARRAALRVLQHELEREPHVAAVLGPAQQPTAHRFGVFLTHDGNAARYVLVFSGEPTDAPAIASLRRVESDLPALLRRARLDAATTYVGGETALGIEADKAILTSIQRIAAAVFVVSFLFLAVYLRAIVAPLYLLLASALALAATFGLTTLVFQGLLGYDGITYYLPVAIGVLLISLGSDYNLFVVGRIWQEAQRRPIREAVVQAAPRASRAISVAGLAMACSFALLAIVPLRPFRVFAFAMAVGILLDSLLVRSVLVPGLIVAFGRFGFWPRAAPHVSGATDPEPEHA